MRKIFIFSLILIQFAVFSQKAENITTIGKDIELRRFSENVYIYSSYWKVKGYGIVEANGLLYVNKGKAILIDSPWNDKLTMQLYTYIVDSLKIEIIGFVPTHWHNDRMGGIDYLHSKGIRSYSNQRTIEIAKTKALQKPDIGFKDSLELKIGDEAIQCLYFGPAHTQDNIVVWIPKGKILYGGCIIKSSDSKDLGNTIDGDLKAYPETLDKIYRRFRNANIVIPGHGNFGGIELIKHTKELSNKQK
jgi:metallo-beta-lactamase class B